MCRNTLSIRFVMVCLFLVASALSATAQVTTEGSLHALDNDNREIGLCPLKRTDVKAAISGFISRVTVTQTFQNPYDRSIEALYTFPLPNEAAVDDMTIQIGDRLVRGQIMERQKAEETFEKAKQEGKVTVLLEQLRPNMFTQSVANITPNAEIKVVISYVETLKYQDDTYEFTFPMTIGQRYIPLSADTEEADRISPPSTARPGHTISMDINVEAGVPVTDLTSNTHEIERQALSSSNYIVRLRSQDEIPNRDFVLKYKTGGVKIEDAVLTHRTKGDGYFTLILQPPEKVMPEDTTPKEIVFVLDTSGSMEGFPIEKAKESMKMALDGLNPRDTFNLITFAGETSILFKKPVPATKENLQTAQEFLAGRVGKGGTEMMKAVKAALAPSDEQDHVRIVCFMTDGYVGNEKEIIGEVRRHPNARVFAFGIGSSVNHYLLDEIAHEGRGEVDYVDLNDDGTAAAKRFYERTRNPLLTDISLEFQGVATAEMFPTKIPDLFDAKPVIVVGKYRQGGQGKVILRGKMEGQEFTREIPVNFPETAPENDVLATLWARRKIAEIGRRDYDGLQTGNVKDDLRSAILALGLEYRLMTPFTAFVAVDEQIVNAGPPAAQVEVPNATPAGTGGSSPDGQFAVNGARTTSNTFTVDGTSGRSSGINATVTVTADTSTMRTDGAVGTVVNGRGIQNLPLNGRSIQSLISLSPGVTLITRSGGAEEQPGIDDLPRNIGYFKVDGNEGVVSSGADEGSISKNIGSVQALTSAGGTNGLLALEATNELSFNSFTQVKDGRTPGIQVHLESRSGSNRFSGSLFEEFGNSALNANDSFANSRGLGRGPENLNQFGGTAGGPLLKNKVFFFGDYEGLRLRKAAFGLSEVPSLLSRSVAIPEMRSVLDAFPIPNGPLTSSGFAEFSSVFANSAAHDVFGLRIDASLSNNLSIRGRYGFGDSMSAIRGDGDLSLNTVRRFDSRSNSLMLGVTDVLSSRVVFEGRLNYTRSRLAQAFSLDGFGGAVIDPAISPTFELGSGSLRYDFSGKNTALAFDRPVSTTVTQLQPSASISWSRDDHLINFGGEFRKVSFDIGRQSFERQVLFSGVSPDGVASRINEITRTPAPTVSMSNFSLYAQDEWRVTKRLTLDLGLRWDGDVAPITGRSGITIGNASTEMRDSLFNFAPRGSLALDVFGDSRTVVRGGAGLFFDYGNPVATESFANSSPFAAGDAARGILFNSLPSDSLTPMIVFDRDLRTPRAWQVFAEFQQAITRDFTLSASYNGAFGRDLFRVRTEIDPTNIFVRSYDNSASSDYNAGELQLLRRFRRGLTLIARYSFAKSIDDLSSDAFRISSFLEADPSLERAVSDFDVRHSLAVYGSYDIPVMFTGGWRKQAAKDWTISIFANARTALPVNVNYARVNDLGVTIFRPDLVSNVPLYTMINGLRAVEPAAFLIPLNERQGTLGRNALRGHGMSQVDLQLARRIRLGGDATLQFTARIINVFNTGNLADMNGSLGTLYTAGSFVANDYFGQSTATAGSGRFGAFYYLGGPRTVQLSARFSF